MITYLVVFGMETDYYLCQMSKNLVHSAFDVPLSAKGAWLHFQPNGEEL